MRIYSSCDLLYKHTVNKVMRPKQDIFEFYDLNNRNKIGLLVCHKSELPLRPSYEGSVLAIDFIEVTPKNNGIGTKILKFAKEYSKQCGCNGYLTLKADSSFSPKRIPHLFYRKFGFSTFDKKNDIHLDDFIRNGNYATSKDFPSLLMHYPPQEKQLTITQKCLKLIHKIFIH